MSKTTPHFEELRKKYAEFWNKYYYFRKSMVWFLYHLDRLDEKKQDFLEKVYKPLWELYNTLPYTIQEDLDPLMFVANAFTNAIEDPIKEELQDTESWITLCQIAERKAKEQENERLTLPTSKESN